MRVVLLGASNLVRGLASAIETARLVLDAPALDVFVASGHGRSYGQASRVLGRGLPGILHCGLWKALKQHDGTPVRALLTDVGNDIGYETGAGTLAAWVEECVRRLASSAGDVRLVVTAPPRVSLDRLSDFEIAAARRIFFPLSSITAADVRREVAELDVLLRRLAERWDVVRVEPEADWYGFDPIHVRRSRIPRAWARMLSSWSDAPSPPVARTSVWRQLRLWWSFPERWSLWGVNLRRRQPAATLPGGVRVFFY